jgi:sortase A
MSYLYLKTSSRHRRLYLRPALLILLLLVGLASLLSVILPLLQFQLFYSHGFRELINPLSTKTFQSTTADYTNLTNWFVDLQPNLTTASSPLPFSYRLSIPKLKISQAEVLIGSQDLKQSLVHYPQTALPGQMGNTVIFGHSVLPQFFNPKSYVSIFSTLYTLKPGDDILIDYDRITYRFVIQEIFEVKPDDFSILEQRYDNRYLTLVTCSPPGTYFRRLVLKSVISPT